MSKFLNICQSCLVLFGMMICGLFITGFVGSIPIGDPGSVERQWVLIGGQNIFAFILPAVLSWMVCFRKSPLKAIGASSAPGLRMLGIALAIYALALPALNQTVYWNQEMHLPEAFSSFEEWCRMMERQAESMTEGLLSTDNISVMITNILIIGILTGISEEFFFRGGLQGMLVHCRVGKHAAIWTAAFVFSCLHFQFFGFVPRLLLGAWFGYLYMWSGNIWVSSFAHALNNSLVILSAWFISHGVVSEDFDMLGVSKHTFPYIACISVAITALVLLACHRRGWLDNRPDSKKLSSKNFSNGN